VQPPDDPQGKPAPVTEAGKAPASAPAQSRSEAATDAAAGTLVLPLDVLIPDAQGNIALIEGMGGVPIAIATDKEVAETGRAGANVRAGGVDVSGYRFVRFRSGVTLYFPDCADLTVVPERGAEKPGA
jgi:hypothetical protein